MSPSERLAALHGLNLRERQAEARSRALTIEGVAFALILATLAIAYGVLK
jgi:hypothetical protein